MNDQTTAPLSRAADDEVDLRELLLAAWRQKWIIFACIILGFALAVVELHRATYLYTATLRVAPAQQTQSPARTGGLASLASAAGLGISQDPATMAFILYTKGISSRFVANSLAQRPDIMHRIFADEWNPATQRYFEPKRGFIGSTIQRLKGFLGIPKTQWRSPDAARLQEYLMGGIKTERDSDSSIVTLKYSHSDPQFAAKFLADIHKILDDELRRRARQRAAQHVAYLSEQLRVAQMVDQRTAIAQTLSEQERSLMMASSTLPFAAEPVDFVTSSLRPTSPRPSLVLAIDILVGIVVGLAAAFVVDQVSKARRRGTLG